jgi:hypothetical protein
MSGRKYWSMPVNDSGVTPMMVKSMPFTKTVFPMASGEAPNSFFQKS